MKQLLTVILITVSLSAFSQVSIPKKGGTSLNTAPTIKQPADTTITSQITVKVSYDTTKVVVELLGDDGGEYLQPIYKRAYVIRKLLTPTAQNQQPGIEWQKLYDDKWSLLTYGTSEAKAVTPFEWKAKK